MRTNAGIDHQSRVMGDGSQATAGTAAMRPADFLGVTADATAPAAGDTALTGEITTDGLARAQATYSHSAGVASYLLSKLFTFTRAGGVDRTINKMAVFNASSAGSMTFESLVPSPPTLQLNGDTLTINETVNL